MATLHELLSIDRSSDSQLLGVELAKNDYLLLRELIRLRKEQNVSQTDLAELMGVSQPTVSNFERMESDPRLSTIRRYAKALGIMVRHSAQMADSDVTASCASRFTRANWNAGPRLAYVNTPVSLAPYFLTPPKEASRQEFALGA